MFVIHIGTSGFPIGHNAVMQRIRLTFKGLKLAGFNPLIISKQSVHNKPDAKRLGWYSGLPYLATSASLSRPEGFLSRNINKISGFINELLFLVGKRKKIHTAIYSGVSLSELLYYFILSRLLGFKLIVQYVEYISVMKSRNRFEHIFNDKLFDRYNHLFCDGFIVISEFLKAEVQKHKPGKPIVKIPAICDFSDFDHHVETIAENCLMYCGTIGYRSVIEFILELYHELRERNYYQGDLKLVIGAGDKYSQSLLDLKKAIDAHKYSQSIQFITNLPYNQLINCYLSAEVLIVPMRRELQDIAGFHHKVGEYCASKRPFISNKAGEIGYYFTDNQTAILADEFTIQSYLIRLQDILKDSSRLNSIGQSGNDLGRKILDYQINGKILGDFITKLS